jgi:ubiquinone/menaquinone biosynthesis C-methylase UbiE
MIVPEYSRIAGVYDRMMEHVDYAAWAAYIHKFVQRWVPGAAEILELACGTGSLAVALTAKGYRMRCYDRSAAMIELARQKAERAGRRIEFGVEDLRELSVDRVYDAVLCLYDSVNYLTEWTEVESFVRSVKKIVHPGGVFIFDVCTEKNSLDNFDLRYENDLEARYTRMSRYLPDERLQINEVRIHCNGQTFTEIHRQRIYSLDRIASLLSHVGWIELGRFANLTDKPGTEDDERVHFVVGHAA